MTDETKHCRICGVAKPLELFYRAPDCVDGRRGECRDCFQDLRRQRELDDPERVIENRKRVKRWRDENPEAYREKRASYQKSETYKRSLRGSHLKAKYGITVDDYERLLERQGGVCVICGRPPGDTALHVDHCHDTGRVRGLLCFSCNAAIGHLRHDVDIIEAALVYVATHWRVEGLRSAREDGWGGPGR